MTKQILQIEQLDANALLERFDRLEGAITALTPKQNSTNDTPPEYITRNDVAELFRVTLVTINEWVNKGILKAYKIGRRVYFKRNEVEAALIQKGGSHVQ